MTEPYIKYILTYFWAFVKADNKKKWLINTLQLITWGLRKKETIVLIIFYGYSLQGFWMRSSEEFSIKLLKQFKSITMILVHEYGKPWATCQEQQTVINC